MATPSKKPRTIASPAAALKPELPASPLGKGVYDLVVLVNADGIITYASPTILPLLGYTPEAIVGSHLSALAHPEDRDALRLMLGTVGHTPYKSLNAAYRLRAKHGSTRRMEGAGTNLLQVPGVAALAPHFGCRSPSRRPYSSEIIP